jgi:putative ABC transport system permease protein
LEWKLIELAWRNIFREPKRTLLSVLVIAIASMVMIFLLSLQAGSYATMKKNTLSVFDGFAQIQQPGYLDDPHLKDTIKNPDMLINKIEQLDDEIIATKRSNTYTLLSFNSRSIGAYIVGVEPQKEKKFSTLSKSIKSGRYLSEKSSNDIFIGASIAKNLDVKVGDKVTFISSGLDGSIAADSLHVCGIFESGVGKIDRELVEIHIDRFNEDFSMNGSVNSIVLFAPRLSDIEDMASKIDAIIKPYNLAFRSWDKLEPGLAQAIKLDESSSILWYASLIIIVIVLLLNTLLMSVLERTKEFGTLLSLGMQPRSIGYMIWLELMMMLMVGLGIGILIGGSLVWYFSVYGLALPGTEGVFSQWGLSDKIYTQFSFITIFLAPVVIAISTLSAGILPYFKIKKLNPIEAMRSV